MNPPKPTVLCVDDEQNVVESLNLNLRKRFRVLTALSGAVGLEVYGDRALLRSAVVDAGRRGTGVGQDLVETLLQRARSRGVREVYLLTTTAEDYFPRFGFSTISRTEVAPAVRASEEFRGACPDTAVAMRRVLQGA